MGWLRLVWVSFFASQYASASPQFRPDGTFTIVQFTDLHITPTTAEQSAEILAAILDAEKPDFVAYTGDMCEIDTKSCAEEVNQSATFHLVFDPCEKRGIPWAITFGNWDRKPDAFWTGEENIAFIQNNFPHSYTRQAPPHVQGDSVFDVPIMPAGAADADAAPHAVLYFMDTHANDGCEGIGGTGCIYPSEVAWYNATSLAYRKQNNGHPVPAVAFFHIPLPEYVTVWNEGANTYGRLDEPAGDTGQGIACVIKSSGFLDAAVANGDIKAMTCGHDHDNDYHGTHRGIELMYGRKTGYGSYGPPKSWGQFPQKDGARVIQLRRDASTGEVAVDTWIRLMDGTKLLSSQEGAHAPGDRHQGKCNHDSAMDACRHQESCLIGSLDGIVV